MGKSLVWFQQRHRVAARSDAALSCGGLSSRRRSRDSQGYSTVGDGHAPPPAVSQAPPLEEAEDEPTISPYASYAASLTERAPPIISGWLDKLSPQGCV